MLTFFEGVGGHLKFKTGLIDNLTFRLHYQYTFAILLIACLLQTAQQYLGNPIDCDVDGVPGLHQPRVLPLDVQLGGRGGAEDGGHLLPVRVPACRQTVLILLQYLPREKTCFGKPH